MCLGASRETIEHDYLESAKYITNDALFKMMQYYGKGQCKDEKLAQLASVLNVQPYYIHAAFSAIDDLYESQDDYLQTALGMGKHEPRSTAHHVVGLNPVASIIFLLTI